MVGRAVMGKLLSFFLCHVILRRSSLRQAKPSTHACKCPVVHGRSLPLSLAGCCTVDIVSYHESIGLTEGLKYVTFAQYWTVLLVHKN